MEEYTLVVMAGGASTRFGSLKQLEPVGPNGEFIMDYSIYDAIKVGFNKIVFVINKAYEEAFRSTIGNRIKGTVLVDYVFQDINDIPDGFTVPEGRVKPWGTGHAIYAARDLIKGPFAVINADDFYGREAFEKLISFLKNNEVRNHYVTVCYNVMNTLSEYGSVKRGIALVKNGVLEKITECEVITENEENVVMAKPLSGDVSFKVNEQTISAVNLFGFTAGFMRTVQTRFDEFLAVHGNEMTSEYMVSDIVQDEIASGNATVYVTTCSDKWYGVTYKEDKTTMVEAINRYVATGQYPNNLWND